MKEIFIILAGLTISACAASTAGMDVDPPPITVTPRSSLTPTPNSPTPSSTTIPVPTFTPDNIKDSTREANGQPAIVFHQAGGFAGVDLTWSIYANGTIVTPSGDEHWVEPVVVEDLLEKFTQAGFFDLEQAKSSNICCDFFTYTLAVNNGDKNNVITFTDGDPNAAAVLAEMVSAVQQAIAPK